MNEIEYKQIKPKKLYEQIADALQEMIASGELKPGDKLEPVHKLAEKFQVGRSAIREALSALRAKGLVEMKQGEGTYIKVFDSDTGGLSVSTALLMRKQDVINLLEVRKVLETGAVAYAAKNRTETDIANLKRVMNHMDHASGNKKKEEETDIEFHLEIAKATHNPILLSLMKHISLTMKERMGETRDIWLYNEDTTSEDLLHDHERIFNAVVEQDELKARQLMWNHLTVVEKNLTAYYREK